MTTIYFSKALSKSIISSAGEGNIEAVRQLSARLPADYKNAVQKALEGFSDGQKKEFQDRIVEALQPGCKFHPIRDLIPNIVSYLTPREAGIASTVNSFLLGEISPGMLEALSKTTFFLKELAHPRPARSLEAMGKISQLNLKQRFLHDHPANPQAFGRIKAHMPQILSFLGFGRTNQLALFNPFFKTECYSSLLSLTKKTHISLQNLEDYRRAFGLRSKVEVLQLNPVQARNITSLDLSNSDIDIHDETFATVRSLTEMCPNLTSLNLERCGAFREGLSNAFITHLARCCPYIVSFDLSGLDLLNDALPALGRHYPGLQSIDLRHVFFSEREFLEFLQSCKGLRRINLSITSLTDNNLKAIADNCKQLEEINLTLNSDLSEEALIYFFKSCPNLMHVNLSNVQPSDAAIASLADNCPQLKHVNLYQNVRHTDTAVVSLLKKCPKLESLDLSATRATDVTLAGLVKYGSNLRQIYLTNAQFSDEKGLIAFLNGCNNLKEIKLSGCKNVVTYNVILILFTKGVKAYLPGTDFEGALYTLKREFSYEPTSSLGKLYHAVLKRDILAIQEHLQKIDRFQRDRLLERVGEHFLNDLSIFQEAFESSIKAFMHELAKEEKDRLCGSIYRLAGSPETNDPQWGLTHYKQRLSLLADAISLHGEKK